jgi:hypothetical protein
MFRRGSVRIAASLRRFQPDQVPRVYLNLVGLPTLGTPERVEDRDTPGGR